MEKLRTVWLRISDSLWFVPALLTVAGGAAAVLLMNYGDAILGEVDARELWWVFGGGSDGAQSVLQVISGSLITVTGVIFSVTMIVLQLASSQFTPRVLRQFMADRANQLVLGVFIGTFTYTLIVLRSVRGDSTGEEYVPQVAVTGAVVLALVSIGFLIFFINHIARSVQASIVIDAIASDTIRVVKNVYPERLEPGQDGGDAVPDADSGRTADGHDRAFHVAARRTGYLQSVDYNALMEIAEESGFSIDVDVEIGSYILAGQRVMTAVGADRISGDVEERLEDVLVLGPERTPHQDVKYGVLELMDIAVKAMSPSINDPTTATNAIHRLSEVLLELAWRANGDRVLRDDAGLVRVTARRPRLDDTVGLGFDQVRHYSADNPSVTIVMLRSLGELAALSPSHARSAFVEQLHAVIASARSRVKDGRDVERVESAAAHALARAAAPASTARATTAAPG